MTRLRSGFALCLALLTWGCSSDSTSTEGSEPSAEPSAEPAGPSSADEEPAGGEVASNDGNQATETNFVPALCLADEDCPPGVRCVPFDDAGAGPGVCDVEEKQAQ